MQFNGHAEVNDSNLVLALDGLLNFSKHKPALPGCC